MAPNRLSCRQSCRRCVLSECVTTPDARATGACGFPSAIPLYRADFKNWCGELDFRGLRTFAPKTPDEVVAVANWAARHQRRLRPRGAMHNWSPLSLDFDAESEPIVMANTTKHLRGMELVWRGRPAVNVQAGASMLDLMTFLGRHGDGFTHVPAVGDVTVGGARAIDAHGCAVPAVGEAPVAGQTYGTLSNRVLALTAVVWDGAPAPTCGAPSIAASPRSVRCWSRSGGHS